MRGASLGTVRPRFFARRTDDSASELSMPTLPLMTPPVTSPNACRRVTAPGGYESWQFSATSDDGSMHLVAALHAGWALDRRYLRRYWAYRHWPTRFTPPVPQDYPAVTFALYQRGRRPVVVTTPAKREEFSVDQAGTAIRMNATHAQRGAQDVFNLHVRGATDDARTLIAHLAFRPQVRADMDIPLCGPAALGRHGWVIADPLCDVNGEITLFDEAGGAPRVTPFAGEGCHDHFYGTQAMGDAGKDWLSGRILREDRALLFRRAGSESARVCEASPGQSVRLRSANLAIEGVLRTARGIGYPSAMVIDDVAELGEPAVISSTWVSALVEYHATLGDDRAVALVEILRPRRGIWPLPWD